jgi:prepilin-type processing-associated H-X9-DG protein
MLNAQVFIDVDFDGGLPIVFPGQLMDGTSNTCFFTEQFAWCNGPQAWNEANPWFEGSNVLFSPGAGDGVGIGPSYPVFGPVSTGSPGTAGACSIYRPASPHTGGIMVGMADGSARFVGQGISPATWWYIMTPQGGEVLGSDW